MKINRIKNSSRNIIWGFTQQLCAIFLPFVIRTEIIKFLGSEYLGISNLFSSVLQVLSLAEMGFSSAIIYSLYKPIALDDQDTICALLAYYRKTYRYIGAFILIMGLCLLPILKYLVNGYYPDDINLHILYLVFLFNTVISYFLFAYRSCLLMAHQRNDVYSAITMAVNVTQYIIQILVLALYKSYNLYIIFLPVATIANNIICAIITKKMYPQYYCLGKLPKGKRRKIREKIMGLIIGKVNLTAKNSLDSIFISIFLSLSDVAVYGNYFYIMTAVHTFLCIFATSVSAGVGNSIAIETQEKNYRDFRKLTFLYNWLSSWCFICLLNLYQPFMQMWVGKDMLASDFTMLAFCCYFYTLCAGDIRGVYTTGNGLWWENRSFCIFEILGNIILNWLLIKYLGMLGIISASVITTLFIGNVGGMLIVFKHYFNGYKVHSFYLKHALYIIVLTIVSFFSYFFCSLVPEEQILLCLFIRSVICILVPNLCFFLIFRRFEEFDDAKKLVIKGIMAIIDHS